MLTLYFAFVTFGLFSAVVADVAHSVQTVSVTPA
jgi:hypothetical protein